MIEFGRSCSDTWTRKLEKIWVSREDKSFGVSLATTTCSQGFAHSEESSFLDFYTPGADK